MNVERHLPRLYLNENCIKVIYDLEDLCMLRIKNVFCIL